ncbi:MAG: hypothetical protein EOM32_03370 [Spirochaetia bacterium]|nr:hypothetical protein [Spirochaetia bacterium]
MEPFREFLIPTYSRKGPSMYVQNKNIIIVCEGASEKAYIQELNRYLEEEDIPLHFIPRPSNGGQYSFVVKKYKEVRKDNRMGEILIWVDWDRYQRNDNSDMDNYLGRPNEIPAFLFSYQNFEDFLSMHCDRSEMQRWWVSCISRNHFTTPSHSSEYIPSFRAFMGGNYSKGTIPITIDYHSLSNLRMHQNDTSIPIKCDFADLLFRLLEAHVSE